MNLKLIAVTCQLFPPHKKSLDVQSGTYLENTENTSDCFLFFEVESCVFVVHLGAFANSTVTIDALRKFLLLLDLLFHFQSLASQSLRRGRGRIGSGSFVCDTESLHWSLLNTIEI